MADALKKLFSRMAHTSVELKALQEAVDETNYEKEYSRRLQSEEGKNVTNTARLRGQPGQARLMRFSTTIPTMATTKPPCCLELINAPILSDSPPPKPAPRNMKLLPFQDPPCGDIFPQPGRYTEILPRNATPGPIPTLPGTQPSRNNPNIDNMGKVYPNLTLDKQAKTAIHTESDSLKEGAEEQRVLGTPFTAPEAKSLLRLGWVALEFIRDDQRPCCIIEVSKNNSVTQQATGNGQLKLRTGKDLDVCSTTTAVDASNPETIRELIQSPGSQPLQLKSHDSDKPPRILFENMAFVKIKKRLEPTLGPALVGVLKDEPPKTVISQKKAPDAVNQKINPLGFWMKEDDTGVGQRRVYREFVDHEGKMWRITSIDVTPDVDKDPLGGLGRHAPSANRYYSRSQQGSDTERGDNIPVKRVLDSMNIGWKVFYIEAVFAAPVGVDWPTSPSTSGHVSVSRASTFPLSTDTRPSGVQSIKSVSRTSTFKEASTDIKKSFSRVGKNPMRAETKPSAGRRISLSDQVRLPVALEDDESEGLDSTEKVRGIREALHTTKPSLITRPHPELGNVLGARVKAGPGSIPIHPSIDYSRFVGLGGNAAHIDGYSSTTDVNSSDNMIETVEVGGISFLWNERPPPVSAGPLAVFERKDGGTESRRPLLDWTRNEVGSFDPEVREHYALLRAMPWENTGFGALSTWSAPLRLYANTIMSFPHATTIYWGPKFLQLYNVAWKTIVQTRHPAQLGMPFEQGWPELTTIILPLIQQCFTEGISTKKVDEPLFIDRQVPKEECYFHFHMGPLLGENEVPEGVIEQAFERTNAVIAERRTNTLRALTEASEGVRELSQDHFWKRVIDVLASNPKDLPFTLLYLYGKDECYLEGSLGIPNHLIGKPVAPLVVKLMNSISTSHTPSNGQWLVDATKSKNPGVLSASPQIAHWELRPTDADDFLFADEMFQAHITGSLVFKDLQLVSEEKAKYLQAIDYRGYGEPSTGAIVAPIQPTNTRIHGYLIVGLNPRRPYDTSYQQWLQRIVGHLSTTVARVNLLTEDVRNAVDAELSRKANLAAFCVLKTGIHKGIVFERRRASELHDRLIEATEQLKDSELTFTKFAESIPIGVLILNTQGHFVFVNDAWYDITTYSRQEPLEYWQNSIFEEDRDHVRNTLQKALMTQERCICEFRVGSAQIKRPWARWVIKTIDPDRRKGTLRGFFATVVDVTSIKIAEEYQKELTQQAIENQRRQENFIDITSHELRNPLSAILQSAESILQDVQAFRKAGEVDALDTLSILESARTILLCVNHQTRIIEDILTVSKLDAMLLTVSPVEVKIHELLAKSLSIFDDEVRRKDIKVVFELLPSYHDNHTNWVFADPSRVTQVFVNLITNAIKFTALSAGEKSIKVFVGASQNEPTSSPEMPFLPMDEGATEDVTVGPDWGTGEPLYIIVTVEDNGLGIKNEWQDRLFQRFKQVPKTHITYGGSGLGLFICKKLCYVQGGNIGVFSEEDKGSTFTFFVKVRRAKTPIGSPLRSLSWPSKVEGAAKEFAITQDGSTGAESDASDVSSVKGQYPVVLVVEDNLINQRVLQQQLTREGFTTVVANNGQEAVDMVMNSTFSKMAAEHAQDITVVLMDMEMPIMDGTTATKVIRQVENVGKATKHIPIIGISANARPEQLETMIEAGMDITIAKPFRISDLVKKIREASETTKPDERHSGSA